MILTALLAFAIASCFWISLITGGYHGKRVAWLLVLVLAMVLCGCKMFNRPPATTWLGPSEPLDAMMLAHVKTGKTNVVIYGFRHDTETGGTIVWKMVPLPESNP